MTCKKTQGYLADRSVPVREEVNAKKERFGRDEAISLARESSEVYAAKGKKVVHFRLKKDDPSDDDLAAVLLGPSGNLRAPTFRVGKKLVVGFDADVYDKLFGS